MFIYGPEDIRRWRNMKSIYWSASIKSFRRYLTNEAKCSIQPDQMNNDLSEEFIKRIHFHLPPSVKLLFFLVYSIKEQTLRFFNKPDRYFFDLLMNIYQIETMELNLKSESWPLFEVEPTLRSKLFFQIPCAFRSRQKFCSQNH